MVMVTRVIAGGMGALFIVIALGFWFATDIAAKKIGLELDALAGYATVRADVGGFFITGGAITLLAAVKGNAKLLWPSMLLLISALAGRTLTLAINGSEPASFPPMVVEALAIVLIVVCQRTWPRTR